MSPMNPQIMELVYANKLLAKTLDEVDEKVSIAITKVEAQIAAEAQTQKLISSVEQKLELLPLVIAGKLEGLIEKRTAEAFEDLRTSLDEMRNKLWAIRKDVKQVKDGGTGSHSVPTSAMMAQWEKSRESEKEKEDNISIRKGRFKMDVPISEGSLKMMKLIGKILVGIAVSVATGGGIWSLIDRLKHLASGS